MENNDSLKKKLIYESISLFLTALVILLFFLDHNPWDVYKIIFCIVISILMVFIIPSYRFLYLYLHDASFIAGFRLGMLLGFYGLIMVPLVGSPYFGIRYLFNL